MRATSSRIALVTEGSGDLGSAICKQLAGDGMCVAVHYGNDGQRARDIVDEIIDDGGEAIAVAGDVTDEANMRFVFDMVSAEYGGIDVLVHAAHRASDGRLVDTNLRFAEDVVKTNVFGTLLVNQLGMSRLRSGGAIVNVAPADVGAAAEGRSVSTATRAAIEALSLVLAHEARGKDITVNAVVSGVIATRSLLDGRDGPALATMARESPLGRLGQPSDVADVIATLASTIRWVNGQVIRVNGGVV